LAWHAREVSCHGVEIVFPEFAYEKEVFVNVCGEIRDELGKKVFGEMFDRIETYSAEEKVVAQPVGPVFDLILDLVSVWCRGYYFGMGMVDISKHQIVKVPLFFVNAARPELSVSKDTVNRLGLRNVVLLSDRSREYPINAGEVIPMPIHIRILSSTTRKGIANPSSNLNWITNRLQAIYKSTCLCEILSH
jgi:hypothetical protein